MCDSLIILGISPAMGITAENLAKKYGIRQEEQDELALCSHQRAMKAIDEGEFREGRLKLEVREKGKLIAAGTDEHPLRDTNLEVV
jgi:acetyl-CoA C-acetyltransferase